MSDAIRQKAEEAIEAGASVLDVDILTDGRLDIRTIDTSEPAPSGDDGVSGLSSSDLIRQAANKNSAKERIRAAARKNARKENNIYEEELSTAGKIRRAAKDNAVAEGRLDDPAVSGWQEFKYSFEAAPTLMSNFGIWLTSRFPQGAVIPEVSEDGSVVGVYKTAEERFGADFMAASPEERAAMMRAEKESALAEKYPDVVAQEDPGNALGSFLGSISSPEMLIPFAGQTRLAIGTAGGFLGGIDAAMNDIAQNDQLTVKNVATGVAVGVALPLAVNELALGVAKGSRYFKRKKAEKNADGAQKFFEDSFNSNIASGMEPKQAYSSALEETGLTAEQLTQLARITGRKPNLILEQSRAIEDIAARSGHVSATSDPGFLDHLFGAMDTRLNNILPGLGNKIREHAFAHTTKNHDRHVRVQGFTDLLNKMPKETVRVINKLLMSGKFDEVRDIVRTGYGDDALANFEEVNKLLKEFKAEGTSVGYDMGNIENYYPRLVKDKKGLFAALNKEDTEGLQGALKVAAKRVGRKLTAAEESDVINKFLRGFVPRGEGKPGFVKARRMPQVPNHLVDFYEHPAKSLSFYIRNMTEDIETRKFLGKLGTTHKTGGIQELEKDQYILDSIGGFLQNAKLDADQAELAKEILRAYLIESRRSPSRGIQIFKNLTNAALLGNPVAAGVQLGDLFVAARAFGIRDSLSALFGKKHVDMRDYGLDDIMQEIHSDMHWTARFLDRSLRWSGFKAVDRLGKNTSLNAALRGAWRAVKKPDSKQMKEFAEKWRPIFGEEYPALVDDLREGLLSSRVKLMLWNSLSDVQPISMTKFPTAYAKTPNLRLLYMLRSFTLSQWDIARREIAQEAKRGNYKNAFKNTLSLAVALGAAGATNNQIQAVLQGREPEDLSDAVIQSYWAFLGTNRYVMDKFEDSKWDEAVVDSIAPPTTLIKDLGVSAMSVIDPKKGPLDPGSGFDPAILKHVPVLGKLLYNRVGPGNEKYSDRRERDEREKQREEFEEFLEGNY